MDSVLLPPQNQIDIDTSNAAAYRVFDRITGRDYFNIDSSGKKVTIGNITDSPDCYLVGSGTLSIGTAAPDTSAVLQVNSTTQGFLMPRMTTLERDAIASPATGLEIYNITTNEHEFYDGSIWLNAGGTAAGGPDTSVQFNNSGAFDGDADFTYISSTNTLRVNGQIGIGIAPASPLHVYEDTSQTGSAAGVTIEQDGSGDALQHFVITGAETWTMGIDNSDSDRFAISNGAALTARVFRLDGFLGAQICITNNNTTNWATPDGIELVNESSDDNNFTSIVNRGALQHAAGILFKNVDYSNDYAYMVFGMRDSGGFHDVLTLIQGAYGNSNSTNLIFNYGDDGTNQSEFVMYNDNNASEIARYFRLGYADQITSQGGLNISDANNFVSIGTRTDPDSPLHVYQDDNETGDAAGITIEQDGTGDAIAQFLLSGGQRWVMGIDNSGSDAFKIASSINLGSNDQLVLETDGRSEFIGSLGVNILPASTMHVYEDTSEVGAAAGLTIEQDGTGDAVAQFLTTGGQRWVMGIDNSQDDEFCISSTADLNSNKRVVLQTDGRNYFNGTLGIAKVPDSGYRLDVLTSISVHVRLSTFKAVTIESGKNGSGNSTDLFFNRGGVGFNQSEFAMYNENSSSGSLRYFRMGYSDDIDTSGGLTVWKTRNNVAVGSYTQPDSVLTVSENTTETGDQAGITIIQQGTGDAIAQFLLDGGQRWVMGIDNSASDSFKIASSINLGSNDMFVLLHDAGAFIYSHTDDVLTLGNSTGEWCKISVDDAGSPEGAVTGTGGDVHVNVDGAESTLSLKKSASSSTADWYDTQLVQPVELALYNTAELEALATAGVITISSSTTWYMKGHFDSDVRLVFENRAQLHIISDHSNQSSWTYSGTGTFLTGTGGIRSLEFFDILSSSTGTFANMDLDGRSMNLTLAGLFNWDDLGSLSNGTFISDVSDIFDNVLGFDFFNMKITISQSNVTNTPTGATPLMTVNNPLSLGFKSISVDQLSGSFNAGASLFRLEPALNAAAKVDIEGCIYEGGEIFDTSGSTGTFTAVADAAVSAETITSVTDSSGVARFNFTAPPTLFVNQEVVISGFTTNPDYNGTYLITSTGAGYFEVSRIDFGSNETGSFISNSVTITDTSTILNDGDQITLDTDVSVDYDGGAIVYNQLTNSFQVNATYTATAAGTWSTKGLDQTDPRVLAFRNPDFIDSKYSAYGHVEENVITTTIGTTDVYQAINIPEQTGFITVFATNGAGGTTCTSTGHGLVENQNVTVTGEPNYNGAYTVFNVTTNTFDIAATYVPTVITAVWTTGLSSHHERFKTTNADTGEITYIGNEPFNGNVNVIVAVSKTATNQDYLFSVGKNGVSVIQGGAYMKRTVSTAINVHMYTVPVSLVYGDTIQPIVASVGTTNSITFHTVEIEVS